MSKKVTEDKKLEYQSNENYPWEYEQPSKVWVTNFDVLKKKNKEAEDIEVEIKLDLDGDVDDEQELSNDAEDNEGLELTVEDDLDDELEIKDVLDDIKDDEELEIEADDSEDGIIVESKESKINFDLSADTDNVAPTKKFSWLLASIILAIVIIAVEVLLTKLGIKFYWHSSIILSITWLWRVALLIVWIILGLKKWQIEKDQILASTLVAFVPSVIILAIWKITMTGSIWTWINLIIEPIWMVLVIALVGSLMIKLLVRQKN